MTNRRELEKQIEAAEQRVEKLENDFEDVKRRYEDWHEKLEERRRELESAVVEDSSTFRRSQREWEAKRACETLGDEAGKIRETLEEAQEQLDALKFEQLRNETHEAKRDAQERIREVEREIIRVLLELHGDALEATSKAEVKINKHNRLASAHGRNPMSGIVRMHGLDLDMFTKGVLRAYHAGDIEIEEGAGDE